MSQAYRSLDATIVRKALGGYAGLVRLACSRQLPSQLGV
jgi:hypothetical protein